MKQLLLIVTTYVVLAAQVACGAALSIADRQPPLMWLPVVLALTWFADARGIAWCAVIGLLADGLSDGRFGVEMLAATLTAVLTLPLQPEPTTRSRATWSVWQFAVIATGLLLSRGLGGVLSDQPEVTLASVLGLFAEACYGLILCLFFSRMSLTRGPSRPRLDHA